VTVAAAAGPSLVGAPDRIELSVHALAQLADEVTLGVPARLDDHSPAMLTARAHRIDGRIAALRPGASAPTRGTTLAELTDGQPTRDPQPHEHDNVLSAQRLAVVTNVPTHYRVALFNDLDARLRAAGAALRVHFLAATPPTRSWMDPGLATFDSHTLRSIDIARDRGRRLVPRDLEKRLHEFDATAILVGGFSPAVAGRVALYAHRRGVPFGVWSGEIASRQTAKSRTRRLQRVALLRMASFAIAYGGRAASYLRSLRADLPLVIGRNATLLPERARFTPEGTVELVTVSRAEPEKGLDVLVRAVRRLPDLPCRLTIVGDGPALPDVRRLAGNDSRVRLLGSLPPAETRRVLETANVFLFPSRYDVFGLAVVEAMGAGLAVAVSPHPGVVDDLCVHERNSLIVSGGEEAWACAIERLVADPELRSRLGDAAYQTVRGRWTIPHAAEAMLAGFRVPFLAVERWQR
jgi:glycosyltransferase involved in cell wall biosynthesis